MSPKMWTVWQRKIVGSGEWRPVAELPEDQAQTMAAAKRASGFAAVAEPSRLYPETAIGETLWFGTLDAKYDDLTGSREMRWYFQPISFQPRGLLAPVHRIGKSRGSR